MTTLIVLLVIGAIDIQTELSPQFIDKKLTVGDPFEVKITLQYDEGTEISEPFLDSLGPFAILNTDNTVTQEEAKVVNQYVIDLAAFNTGELNTPEFKFLFRKGEATDTLSSGSIRVEIASTLPEDMADINDLKGPVEYPNYFPFVIAAILVGAIVLSYLAWRFLRRIKKMREPAEPLLPPWIEALVALENIPGKELLGKGLIKKYYYSLSEILKRYLERRFEFNASEQTTTEIVHHLRVTKTVMRDELRQFFLQADLVKYAKSVPSREEQETAIERAKDLVEKTRPVESEVKR